ncbi:ATP-dependent RNA helicase DDX54 isoform X1 [Hydra vulgaris]|uniref:ATP-dependent RNA helicase DDX54 isoform X1 n=1 Tax=Hydra vulgaris TaxID=6087 RepID=UPI0032E9D8FB
MYYFYFYQSIYIFEMGKPKPASKQKKKFSINNKKVDKSKTFKKSGKVNQKFKNKNDQSKIVGKNKESANLTGSPFTKDKRLRKSYSKKRDNSEEEEFEIAIEGNNTIKEKNLSPDFDDKLEVGDLAKEQRKKQKKTGGFQSMGFSYAIYKGIIRKGYKVPTPIQRKTIPVLMDGKDVVAMARTGSGKTAAFLLPLFQKLQTHSPNGSRGLILSPTRELAIQTLKFAKELGKFTTLKFAIILGGDSLEEQFSALHQNPDIIIATPGRFLHLLVEMDIKKLEFIEYVVFDEADRLFEMGFSVQLHEIIARLPVSRQTVLVSATLPKVLVDFAAAGLTDPTLIRLDIYNKISDKLKTAFFLIRPDDKLACLLYILQTSIPSDEQTIIFVATKHHVEYLQQLLTHAGINCSYIYSSLDQTARKINIEKFIKKITKVLIVTDIAARGIDIPMLDNVINFDFPSKPKLFVHRVGRVARAGRTGMAYSFVQKDEMAFLLDLHLFLTQPIKFSNENSQEDNGLIGSVSQSAIVPHQDFINNTTAVNSTLQSMYTVMLNGYKQYIKSRENASVASIKRSKEINYALISIHPIFNKKSGSEPSEAVELNKLLLDLQKFKPKLTVFETMNTKKSKETVNVMKEKRLYHTNVIEHCKAKSKVTPLSLESTEIPTETLADDKYVADVFSINKNVYKDENYIPHQSIDIDREKGFQLTSFEKEAQNVSLEVFSDDRVTMKNQKAAQKWDRKRKRFVSTTGNNSKKIKTESGNLISSSYKSNAYNQWIKKRHTNSNEDDTPDFKSRKFKHKGKVNQKIQGNAKGFNKKQMKGALKSKEQIVKSRMSAVKKSTGSKGSGRGGGKSGRGAGRGGSKSKSKKSHH